LEYNNTSNTPVLSSTERQHATVWSIPDLLEPWGKIHEGIYKSLNIEACREKNNGGGSGWVNMAKSFSSRHYRFG
jgi:hypothetical protein